MTPEEKKIIQIVISERARLADLYGFKPLDDAILNLIYSCQLCNTARHVCPGCGADIGHGDTACSICQDTPRNPDIPATQDAQLEQWGREMAEMPGHGDKTDAAAAREEPASWVPRTWKDVRTGDRVRLPGTEHVALIERATPIRQEWLSHRERLIAMAVRINGKEYKKNFDGDIEIEMSPGEVLAAETFGWENRLRVER